MSYVLFDIGGTQTRVALSHSLEKVDAIKSFPTPKKFTAGMDHIISTVAELGGETIEGVAGGVRGLLAEDKSGIESDGVLTDWAHHSIIGALSKQWKAPVYLENDTALAGLGEAIMGAGKGQDIVVYHTISTGVGGVKVEHGQLDEASYGFEPGHQILDIDRTVLGEDVAPTLENLVSGTAVAQRFGVPAQDILQSDVLWDELAEYLAQGLRNTILYWSPDIIILGGAMIVGDPRIPLDAIRKYTVASLDDFVPCPFITIAQLGDTAGIHGALQHLRTSK